MTTALGYVPSDQPLTQPDYPPIASVVKETAETIQTIATSQIPSNPCTDSNAQLPNLSDMNAFEMALDNWIEQNEEHKAAETKNNDDPNKDFNSAERAQKRIQGRAENREKMKRRNTLCCCCRSLYRAWTTCKQSITKAH